MPDLYNGYTGLFRVPYDPNRDYSSAIYCITDRVKSTLIMIPLVPNFFVDAYKIAKHPQYTTIYIVPPAVDVLYVSDVYNLYQELTKLGNKHITILSNVGTIVPTSDDFFAHINFGDEHIITKDNNDGAPFNITIKLHSKLNPKYRMCSDIEISDGTTSVYFSQMMSVEKLDYLATQKNLFVQIHMSFGYNTYGGLTYLSCMQHSKELQKKLIVNGFTSYDEMAFCRSRGIPVGTIRYNDFVFNVDGRIF